MIVRATEEESKLRVRPVVLKSVYAHARDAAPAECCGALLGSLEEVARAVRLSNEAERPGLRYRIGAEQVLRLEEDARRKGMAVLGFYHSHPRGPATPSPLDVKAAWPWYTYLIKGVDGLRAFRLLEDRSAFTELRISPSPASERPAS